VTNSCKTAVNNKGCSKKGGFKVNIKTILVSMAVVLFFAVAGAYGEETPHVGIVTETIHVDNYTYIKIDENGEGVWLASSPMDVSVGERVEYIGGVPMKDFRSKSLKRTFESILLITRIKVLDRDNGDDEEKESSGDYHETIPEKEHALSQPVKGEIAKAENGKTIEEILAARKELKDQEVVVRAKVMKVTENIMGKNWITLRDGTGTAPADKIIAITSGNVTVGDIVTVRGVVKNDVDLGAGYKYDVLIGDARITK
jgi:hypothetical protein